MTLRYLTLGATALATVTVLCIAMRWSPTDEPAVDTPPPSAASGEPTAPANRMAATSAARPASRAPAAVASGRGSTAMPSAPTAPVVPAPSRAERRAQRREADAAAAARRVELFERNISAVDAALTRARASGSSAQATQLERRRTLLIARRDAEAAADSL